MILDNSKLLIEDNLKSKAKIIEVLGEEMFNVCLENPAKAIAFSWLSSFSTADFDKANGINSVFSNKLLEIREELGEELSIWCSKNYKGLEHVISILNSYVDTYEDAKKTRNKLYQLIVAVAANNYDGKITPLISAFGVKDGTNKLLELFGSSKINYVRDLRQLLPLTIDEMNNIQLVGFLNWLSEDKLAIMKHELHNLFKKARDEEIIRKRANGATLEETSTGCGLTHEGVRLIEKKFQGHFDQYMARIMPHYILYAFGKNSCYISLDEIKELLGDLASIFTYYLKVSNCSSTAHWSEELNGFIIGEKKWYEQLKKYKKSLPEIFDFESVDEVIVDVIDNLVLPITFEDTKRLILADYTLSGTVYLKKRMSLSRMYYVVLEKYYPDGIKLYDDSEAIRFRNYVRGLFGDVDLPENNRAIDVRVTELTILCDKGKRILPNGIKIPIELLRKIHDAIIEFDRNEIMFRELFERFKNELLENSNITNKYFLQGVLRQNYSYEFNFTRYALKKSN
ncbi:MAG: hypothetical protein P4L59_04390 [Desulfosporosinus sp.]|nr:hypothetical protein [Desulfosporosinus sp.]